MATIRSTVFISALGFMLFFVNIPLLYGARCLASSRDAAKSETAEAALIDFFKLESTQDYSTIYGRLSEKFRKKLRSKNYNVKTADDYRRLRLSSEARWYNFKIMGQILKPGKSGKFLVQTTIQEAGEEEQVTVIYCLIEEKGQWKVDEIDYWGQGDPEAPINLRQWKK